MFSVVVPDAIREWARIGEHEATGSTAASGTASVSAPVPVVISKTPQMLLEFLRWCLSQSTLRTEVLGASAVTYESVPSFFLHQLARDLKHAISKRKRLANAAAGHDTPTAKRQKRLLGNGSEPSRVSSGIIGLFAHEAPEFKARVDDRSWMTAVTRAMAEAELDGAEGVWNRWQELSTMGADGWRNMDAVISKSFRDLMEGRTISRSDLERALAATHSKKWQPQCVPGVGAHEFMTSRLRSELESHWKQKLQAAREAGIDVPVDHSSVDIATVNAWRICGSTPSNWWRPPVATESDHIPRAHPSVASSEGGRSVAYGSAKEPPTAALDSSAGRVTTTAGPSVEWSEARSTKPDAAGVSQSAEDGRRDEEGGDEVAAHAIKKGGRSGGLIASFAIAHHARASESKQQPSDSDRHRLAKHTRDGVYAFAPAESSVSRDAAARSRVTPARVPSADPSVQASGMATQPMATDTPLCLSPVCVLPAQRLSKYCSAACGMTVARLRLLASLKQVEPAFHSAENAPSRFPDTPRTGAVATPTDSGPSHLLVSSSLRAQARIQMQPVSPRYALDLTTRPDEGQGSVGVADGPANSQGTDGVVNEAVTGGDADAENPAEGVAELEAESKRTLIAQEQIRVNPVSLDAWAALHGEKRRAKPGRRGGVQGSSSATPQTMQDADNIAGGAEEGRPKKPKKKKAKAATALTAAELSGFPCALCGVSYRLSTYPAHVLICNGHGFDKVRKGTAPASTLAGGSIPTADQVPGVSAAAKPAKFRRKKSKRGAKGGATASDVDQRSAAMQRVEEGEHAWNVTLRVQERRQLFRPQVSTAAGTERVEAVDSLPGPTEQLAATIKSTSEAQSGLEPVMESQAVARLELVSDAQPDTQSTTTMESQAVAESAISINAAADAK